MPSKFNTDGIMKARINLKIENALAGILFQNKFQKEDPANQDAPTEEPQEPDTFEPVTIEPTTIKPTLKELLHNYDPKSLKK